MATCAAVRVWGGWFSAAVLVAGCGRAAVGGETSRAPERAASGFSFAVYGDSRSMMLLPDKERQEAEARKLMVDVFAVAVPEKAAGEIVKKHVKLSYDPTTKELATMVMPFFTASQVTTLTFDKGWVTQASVEDIKLLPGVHRTMYRSEGGAWVAREVVKEVQRGRAEFVLHTGDLVWWGKQAASPSENPYWKRASDEVLKQLPPPDAQMRAAGLAGRMFPAAGNHEVWYDDAAQGFLATFPYLKALGVSAEKLIYKFDYHDTRFIFLWTGKYEDKAPTGWTAAEPNYEEQMNQLRQWLEEARAAGIRKVFVTFHTAVYSRSGMGGIPASQNPHKLLASYAKDLDIVVLNGHVHTTELYDVDGVKYMVLGGGGAEQDPILPGRTHLDLPPDYPREQYWKGEDPREEYNYVLVDVQPGQPTKFTLNRFRPQTAVPFATVELHSSSK
jgi:hypothetical protein